MISKTIVVLANSVKKSGRCLAGKEVVRLGNKWKVGNWIRPVGTTAGGEVPTYPMTKALGHDPQLLEIIEIPLGSAAPLPDQPENWLLEQSFAVGSWKPVGYFEWDQTSELLDKPPELWNDPTTGPRRVKEGFPREMRVPASLYFVKPEKIGSIRVWTDHNPYVERGTKKHRLARIRYAGVWHDCNIDDPNFAERYYPKFPSLSEPAIEVQLSKPDATLVSLSVTGAFRGYHYKIAAAFFETASPKRRSVEMNTLFTIGHSNHEIGVLVGLLRRHSVQVVANVRSQPYSARFPQFNRSALKSALRANGLQYVFLGHELGARRDEADCYVDGQARYDLVAKTDAFAEGLDRVLRGLRKYRVALLCAEIDPLTCHRTILVSRHLRGKGFPIQHILADGSLESHQSAENRLLGKLGKSQPSLFATHEQLIEQAYDEQGYKIAFRRTNPVSEEELQPTGRK